MWRSFLLSTAFLLSVIGMPAEVQRGATLPRKGSIGVGVAPDPSGVKVSALAPGGAGQVSGLNVGDVLRTFNGKKLTDPQSFTTMVRSLNAGDRFDMTVLR